ncbi:ribonuclease HI [Desulfobotulus alkaliphilus]|uniref:Ribonuclease H n=1 Tax=Desulfobotulus alkaliphilus TaxID=622671 RepID=A0A562REW4_9BACT|nr:ribonuclease H family protein [Desulfobotulus alkaliphilus]TWI66940.1 ribonuclease HI [Desulfobotulus alkaliphilus]
MASKKYYAVLRGKKPGIYKVWTGGEGAQVQVMGFPGARYKGFEKLEDAEAFMAGKDSVSSPGSSAAGKKKVRPYEDAGLDPLAYPIHVFSDGGAIGNPGPGGYGSVVVMEDGSRQEFSGGFSLTTNNRMELLGAIIGLEAVKDAGVPILLTSDSRYLVQGIEKKWARGWRARGWKKSDGSQALNPDLWKRLLDLLDHMDVRFQWVKGHSGHLENERCDALAQSAARGSSLPPDTGYKGKE